MVNIANEPTHRLLELKNQLILYTNCKAISYLIKLLMAHDSVFCCVKIFVPIYVLTVLVCQTIGYNGY